MNEIKKKILNKVIFNLGGEKKEEIALDVIKEANLGPVYWVELILAGIIATFGLLNNSVAVVIGAMLIAPLFRPIQAVSFGIITGQHKISWTALKNIVLSIILVIFLSYIFAKLVPISFETDEILARTRPNILDFFIAVFSAMIAFLGIMYKEKLSMGIAGVAMAASLLPPLSVVGIEWNLGNFEGAWGSFLLFLTNIVAIIFTGIWLFFFYGFRPTQDKGKVRFKRNMYILIFIIILISIPLVSSLEKINREILAERQVSAELKNIFKESSVKLYKIQIKEERGKDKVFLGLKIPEGKEFYVESQRKIRERISDVLQKEIDLEIEILRIAQIKAPEKEPIIIKNIRSVLEKEMVNMEILDLNLTKISDNNYKLKIIFSLNQDTSFTNSLKESLEEKIASLDREIKFDFSWLPLEQGQILEVKTPNPEDELKKEARKRVQEIFVNDLDFDAEYKIKKLSFDLSPSSVQKVNLDFSDIEKINLDLDIYIERGRDLDLTKVKEILKKNFNNAEIKIDFRIFNYERKSD